MDDWQKTPAFEAAALWGIAQNPHFPVEQRLQAALQSLEYYGNKEAPDGADG